MSTVPRRRRRKRFQGLGIGIVASLIATALWALWSTRPVIAARSFLSAQWPLLVFFCVCLLLLLAYRRWVYKRKSPEYPYRLFDLILVCFLIATASCLYGWCHLRHAAMLRKMDEMLPVGPPGMETQILSFLQRRRDFPNELTDDDYTYEQMVVNLFLAGKTSCFERTMRGEPNHPQSSKPIKVSFGSLVNMRRPWKNMSFEWLDGPNGQLIELRRPLRRQLTEKKYGIRGIIFYYEGFDDEFWSRRRFCVPDSMQASDFFMFYIDEFMHVEGTRVDVNFFADRPVRVALETVPVDARGLSSLRREPVPPLQTPPDRAAWDRVPHTRGRPLQTTASWRPPVLRREPQVALVVHFTPRKQP